MKKKQIKRLGFVILIILSFFFGFLSRGLIPAVTQPRSKIILPDAKEGKYLVTKVLDGDTIELETGEKLRFQGIDAPEPNQRWGTEASEYNKKTVLNKNVRVEFDKNKLDKYGRLLAYVWIDDILINEKLVEEGYARVNLIKGEAKLKYLERLQKAEEWARDHHNGVWLDEWIKGD